MKGIEKDLLKKNIILENRYIALNYGRDAQRFYTKSESSELLYWWEESSLLQGIPKSVLEHIYQGEDVIISVCSSKIEKIQKVFEKETYIIVIELTADETTLKMKFSSNPDDSEIYLKERYKNYLDIGKNMELKIPKLVRVYHNGSIENGKKNLKNDLLMIREEFYDSNGKFEIKKPYQSTRRISTNHENYCFMNPLKCCEYDRRTEICNICHLTKKEKEKVKLNLKNLENEKIRKNKKNCECEKKVNVVEWTEFLKREDSMILQ